MAKHRKEDREPNNTGNEPKHGKPGTHRDTGYVGTRRVIDGHETDKK